MNNTLCDEPSRHGKDVDGSTGTEHHPGYFTYIHIWAKLGKAVLLRGQQQHAA